MTDWKNVVAHAEAMGEDYEILLLEPRDVYDPCLVGVVERFNDTFALYDRQKVIEAIMASSEGDEEDEDYDARTSAMEHYQFNIVGGWVGSGTPAFLIENEEDM